MKISKHKTGVTLIEILVVVVIIAILASMVIGIASRIDTQGKDRVIKNTLELLDAALGEFGDYEYNFKGSYIGLDFPPDCNGFLETDLEAAFQDALGAASTPIDGGTHNTSYSGSEVVYFFLSRVPESRKILDKIDKSLITQKGSNGGLMKITVNPGAADEKTYPLLRVIDPWGETLRYSYYENAVEVTEPTSTEPGQDSPMTFPVVISAGPDGLFGTADDIKNR